MVERHAKHPSERCVPCSLYVYRLHPGKLALWLFLKSTLLWFFPPYCPNPPYHYVWDSEEESNFFDLEVLHRETIEHR